MVAPRFSAIFLPISSRSTTQSPCSDFHSHLYMDRLIFHERRAAMG
jgi:hypothetical protein